MFNQERKQQFLKQKSDGAILSNNLRDLFEKTQAKEEQLGRDVAEWTSGEIIDFFKWYGTKSIQSLIMLHNGLTSYADWCLLAGLVKDNQNHFREVNSEMLCKCINTQELDKLIITRKELLDTIKQLPNKSDQFIFLALFEGIPSKDRVLVSIKVSDLNGNELTLCNGEKRIITDDLVKLMKQANEEDTYQSLGKREMIYKYAPRDTVIKPPISRKGIQTKETVGVTVRVRSCLKWLGKWENLTMKLIRESGRIDYIKRFAERENVKPEDIVINNKYRIQVEKIYGDMQNRITYLNTFGKYLT